MKNRKKWAGKRIVSCLLALLLIASAVPGQAVLAETESIQAETEMGTEAAELITEPVVEVVTETSTEPATNSETETEVVTETGTEASEGSESVTEAETEAATETEPSAETESNTETNAETEPVTESETFGETSGKSEPETESETQNMPPAQVQSAPPAQNQILEDSAKTDEAVQSVQELIDALPTAEELKAMSLEKQQAAYEQVQAAYDAYNALTDEQKEQITGAEVINDLFDVFNGMVALAADNFIYSDVTDMNGTVRTYTGGSGESITIAFGIYSVIFDVSDTLTVNNAITSNAIGARFTIQSGTVRAGSMNLNFSNLYVSGGNLLVTGDITTTYNTIQISNGHVAASSIAMTGAVNDTTGHTLTITGGIVDVGSITVQNTGTGPANFTVNGNSAVVFADTVTVSANGTSSKNYQNGVVFEGISGNVYGSVTLPGSITIPEGYTLNIGSNTSLTVPSGVTIDNYGTINVNGGTLTNNGTINNYGTISGKVDGNTPMSRATVSVTVPESATYGESISLEATVMDSSGANVNSGSVSFYQGTADNGTLLGTANVSNGTATLSNVALNSTNWTPSNSPYTITAVYSGGTGLLGGSGQGTLSVSMATPTATPQSPFTSNNRTENSISLSTVSDDGTNTYGPIQYGYTTGNEESVPNGRWQYGTEFTGLQPGTDYTFYTRYSGNDFYNPSSASTSGLTETTVPSITISNLESGYVGVPYSQTLQASAASDKTVTWALHSGSLPAGLTLNSNGTITGTPEETVSNHRFTVQAIIKGGSFGIEDIYDTATLSITIERGTPADPKEGEGYDINYEAETVTAKIGYELSATNSEDATGKETLNVTPGTNVYVRLKETETYNKSNWVEVSILTRPDAPDLSIDTQAEGVILSENYRYSFNGSTYGEGDWQQGSSQLIQVEPGDTIYIYDAAVNSGENPHFKSEIKSITAPVRTTAPPIPTIDYTNEALNGTLEGMEYRIGESGSWRSCIDGAMDLKQYFGWDGTAGVAIYFRTAATSSNYASRPTAALTIPPRPTLDVKVTGVSAKKFTVTVEGAPTGADLTYRARGTGEYADYDSGVQTGGTFSELKANVRYDVSIECAATNSSFSAETSKSVTTNGATYTVSIPSQATAGGKAVSISITEDTAHPFDLGYGGQVNVKIKDGENIDNGILTLTREGASNTVTSALSVGGSRFTDLEQNVATFREDSKNPVSLSFAKPAEQNIPAGNYTGTVNFEISYTQ